MGNVGASLGAMPRLEFLVSHSFQRLASRSRVRAGPPPIPSADGWAHRPASDCVNQRPRKTIDYMFGASVGGKAYPLTGRHALWRGTDESFSVVAQNRLCNYPWPGGVVLIEQHRICRVRRVFPRHSLLRPRPSQDRPSVTIYNSDRTTWAKANNSSRFLRITASRISRSSSRYW